MRTPQMGRWPLRAEDLGWILEWGLSSCWEWARTWMGVGALRFSGLGLVHSYATLGGLPVGASRRWNCPVGAGWGVLNL